MSLVIRPVPVTPAMLVSSSVPENEKPAWDAVVDYAVGDQVTYADPATGIDQWFESVQTPNVGNNPATDPLHWTSMGPSNRWRMFDALGEKKTTATGPLVVKILPGTRVDSIALRGLRATQVTIDVHDGDGGPLLYTFTQRLTRVGIRSWFQYFFEPFSVRDAITLTNLPLAVHACLTITIEGGATVAVSDLVVGRSSSIGDVEYGAQAGIVSYGRKDVSPSGGSRLQKGRFARQNNLHMMVDNAQKDRIFKTLADLRETPCLFQGSPASGHELLTLFGIYENFSVDITYVTTSYLTLDLLGFAEKTEDS